jgi:hypothetical protein
MLSNFVHQLVEIKFRNFGSYTNHCKQNTESNMKIHKEIPSKNARKQREQENLKLKLKQISIGEILDFCKITN